MLLKISICFFVVCFLVSCEPAQDNYSAVNIVGHGANGLENVASIYHDNTAEAIELAIERLGCAGVELDVQLSADGSLWLFHDELLERETTGKGSVNDHGDAYLSGLKYNSLHREKLVCISKSNINFKSKRVFFDLKHYNAAANKVVDRDQLLKAIQNFQLTHKTLDLYLITNNHAWVPYLMELNLPVYAEISGCDNLQTEPLTACTGFVIKNRSCSADQVRILHEAGKKVVIFEVRSPKWTRRALKKQPDCLITDDIRVALIEKER